MKTYICDNCYYEDYKCECDWVDDEEFDKHMIEVDYEIQPAVTILNQKGYKTKSSCSGHSDIEPLGTYIAFERPYQFNTLPDGWRYDFFTYRKIRKEYRHIMRPWRIPSKVLHSMNEVERDNYIEKVNSDLITWAEELEDCKSKNILDIVLKTKYEKNAFKFAIEHNLLYFPPYICE